jgi:hypothetical protein
LENKIQELLKTISNLKQDIESLEQSVKAYGINLSEPIPPEDCLNLIKLAIHVWEKLDKNSMNYKIIQTQLECLSLKSANGFRWDPYVLHWFSSIYFYGGASAIKIILGKGCKGKEEKKLLLNRLIGIYLVL